MGLFLLIAIIFIVVYNVKRKGYENTEYYIQTKNPYLKVMRDKGLLGEFYTYKYLKNLKGYKRYLFNCYLPKDNGETTEIDVILLHESGIYVFESKNYSGWIFGTETQKYWTQTLPTGRGKSQKSKFFNPIIQNKVHLKWLQAFLGDNINDIYSYIVFSDRCKLKNINLTSNNHYVINRYNILGAVNQNVKKVGIKFTANEIDDLYKKLYPLTQVDEVKKQEHIENIKRKQQEVTPVIKLDNTSNEEEKDINEVEEKHCPRCGGKLVLRTATRGSNSGKSFMGCSNYPKCRYIENI